MNVDVVKRDGSLEQFNKNKIVKVVKTAGLTEEKAEALATKVETEIKLRELTRITSKQIRDMVAAELKLADEYVYGLYSWYEKVKDKENKK